MRTPTASFTNKVSGPAMVPTIKITLGTYPETFIATIKENFVDGVDQRYRLVSAQKLTAKVDLKTNVAIINDLVFSVLNTDDQADALMTAGLRIGLPVSLEVSWMDGNTQQTADDLLILQGTVKNLKKRDYTKFTIEVTDIMTQIYEQNVCVASGNQIEEGFYPLIFGSFGVDHHELGDNLAVYNVATGVDVLLPQQEGSLYKHHNSINVAPANASTYTPTFGTPPRGQKTYLVHNGRLTWPYSDLDCGLKSVRSVWAYDAQIKRYVNIPPIFDAFQTLELSAGITSTTANFYIDFTPHTASTKTLGRYGYIKIDSEFIYYNTLSTDNGRLLVEGAVRGQLGTSASSHFSTATLKIYQYHFHRSGFDKERYQLHLPLVPTTAHAYLYPASADTGSGSYDFVNQSNAIDRDGTTFAWGIVDSYHKVLAINFADDNLSSAKKIRLYVDSQIDKTAGGTFKILTGKRAVDLNSYPAVVNDLYTRSDAYAVATLEPAKLVGNDQADYLLLFVIKPRSNAGVFGAEMWQTAIVLR